MKRPEFIQQLIVSFFGAALLTPNTTKANTNKWKYLYSGTVAGTAYYDFPDHGSKLFDPPTSVISSDSQQRNRIEKGEFTEHPAQLVLEPQNEFDFRAVEVYCLGYKMGYIPRRHNKIRYNLLKDGATLKEEVRVVEVEHTHPFSDEGTEVEHILRIRVYLDQSIA